MTQFLELLSELTSSALLPNAASHNDDKAWEQGWNDFHRSLHKIDNQIAAEQRLATT